MLELSVLLMTGFSGRRMGCREHYQPPLPSRERAGERGSLRKNAKTQLLHLFRYFTMTTLLISYSISKETIRKHGKAWISKILPNICAAT